MRLHVQLPIRLHLDSQSAAAVLSSRLFRDGTKHMQVKYYFIRDLIEQGKVKIIDVDTTNEVADILTKPTVGTSFTRNRNRIVESTK
jgi:hypothetical protein